MTGVFMRYRGAEAKGAALTGAVRGVNLAMERLRAQSVERAPIDMGDLRGSATVQLATEQSPTSVLVFDEPYAAVQHENESFRHTAGAAGEPAGEARYVAKNYEDRDRAQEYRDIIGKGIRDAFNRS